MVLLERGLLYFEAKQYELSIKDFDAAIKVDPEFAEAYFHKAQSLLKIKQTDAALTELQNCEDCR